MVLVSPEIAPNTGNIIRLCANTGSSLHLVEPLGFSLDDRLLKRAGLDYHELTNVTVHQSFSDLERSLGERPMFTFSSGNSRRYDTVDFADGDVLVFGTERTGLDRDVLTAVADAQRLAIPMQPGNRSLNLANAVTAVVYEAWRQHDFLGAAEAGSTTSETPGAQPFDT